MAQIVGTRDTNDAITETRLVRYVSWEDAILLEPDKSVLLTFMMQLKAHDGCDSPRIEWFEDDYIARWAQNSGATVVTAGTTLTLATGDGVKFVVNDVFIVPNAVTSSTAPEQILVTAISTDSLTIVRGFAGSTARQILPNEPIAILGQSHAEGGTPPSAKSTSPAAKISYTQIFKQTVDLTKTAVASRQYAAANGERMRLQTKAMSEFKIAMNRQLLFGKASEDLTGSTPRRTTMGVNSVISTNITNASGTLTRQTMETFARQAFRYGSKTKALLACPMLISAVSAWGNSFLQLRPDDSVLGLNVTTLRTPHGDWKLVKDWLLEDGVSGQPGFGGWAFSLDLDMMATKYLSGNGQNRDIKITENVIQDGRDAYVDEILAEMALCVRQEKTHAKMYNITGYSA